MTRERGESAIARFAIDRRVTTGMAVLAVLVLGLLSLERLPLEYLPTFSSSNISVRATYASSSPEEVERLVVRPLEESLGGINGVETMSASSSAGSGSINLTFVDGTDMELAAVEVRDRIDRVRHRLPSDLTRLQIRRFQSTDIPVIRFHLSADWPRERLFDFTENVVQRRLERLTGVAQVSVGGLRTPTLLIELDPARVEAHGISLRDITSLLRDGNKNVSVGDIDEGGKRLLVRAVGQLDSLDAVRRLPLNADGLRLGDVAEVTYKLPKQTSFNYLNGVEALTVRVNKISTSNLLEVVDAVKAELKELKKLPEANGLNIRTYRDSSNDVRKGLSQLSNAGFIGGGLAILAVLFFLRRFRTTVLVAVAIPVSVIGTFVCLYFLRLTGLSDITLNVVSLAGLMLSLGMLVDNSIVVVESIFRHSDELGEDPRTAALNGTSEVALPITAATLTTLCVFLPLIFMTNGGWMAISMKNIATTVSIVVAVSLVVALTVVPMVAASILGGRPARSSRFLDWIGDTYESLLRFTLRHRFVFVIFIAVLLYGSFRLVLSIERTFSSRSEERQVTLSVDVPRQYAVEDTQALYEELYQMLNSRRQELDIADITYSYDRGTGRARGGYGRGRRMEIYLTDEEVSTITTSEAREKIRALLPEKAGAKVNIQQGRRHGRSSGVEVELMGDDPLVLELVSRKLSEALAEVSELRDVDTSLESGDEEIRVAVNGARVLQAGISSQVVAQTVSSALSSRPVGRFKTTAREIDLVVQFREQDRETLEQLKKVPVHLGSLSVPLSALAEFSRETGPRSIDRENHRSKVKVTANTAKSGATMVAMGVIREFMSSFSLPPGYEWSFGRWNRHMQRDQMVSAFAMLFALGLIYMLMAALSESFAQPFTIMFSVPFALLGVGVVMKLAKQSFDTMAVIGLVILMGVVVNNAIVLLDHISQLRTDGMSRNEAIVHGGRHRIRPILMTAVTTILGLGPMVAPILFPSIFGPVEGRAGTWAPIGLVIMGGLTTSTFLTLMIIPTVYSLIDDLAGFSARVVANVRR